MYEDFVKERITQLRLKKGVSEYQMSYDLGHSRGYVYNISSGKALPPLKEFLRSAIISRSRHSSFLIRLRSILSLSKRLWRV